MCDQKPELRKRFQFSLKELFLFVTGIAVLLGAYFLYGELIGNAQREAVRQAVRDGRLKSDPFEETDK